MKIILQDYFSMITKYNECIGEICSYTHEMRFADLALDSSFFVFCNKKNPGKITVYKSETLAKIPYFFVVTLYIRRTVFVAIMLDTDYLD